MWRKLYSAPAQEENVLSVRSKSYCNARLQESPRSQTRSRFWVRQTLVPGSRVAHSFSNFDFLDFVCAVKSSKSLHERVAFTSMLRSGLCGHTSNIALQCSREVGAMHKGHGAQPRQIHRRSVLVIKYSGHTNP